MAIVLAVIRLYYLCCSVVFLVAGIFGTVIMIGHARNNSNPADRSAKRFFCILAIFLVAHLGFSQSSHGIEPQDVEVFTPVYHTQVGASSFPRGTYRYTVSWQGIPAAEASVNVEQEGLKYRVVTTAKTYSGVDILYKLRYRAEGVLSAIDFLPSETRITQQENSRFRDTEIKYLDNGDISTIRSQIGRETVSLTFDPNNFTLDPISSAFIARGLDWDLGKTAVFDTFNGKTRYLIQLTAIDKKTLRINGVDRDVWIISPRVKKLTSQKPDKKLREAFIYLTADPQREIIKIESEVFIGTVTTRLEEFVPSEQPAPGTSMVQNAQPIKWVF